MPRSRFNLDSPNQIRERCVLAALERWFEQEIEAIPESEIRMAVAHIAKHVPSFVRFPARPALLWKGCNRVATPPAKQRIHRYPDQLVRILRPLGIQLDTRSNGPAIASYKFAGGERPGRFGTTNAWSIHHLYSGKFPYIGRNDTLHAPKQGDHFTQSAGLVAIHPLADALCDEFPAFSWLLRAMAFQRFGYDPDGVFSNSQVSELGFGPDHATSIVFSN